MRRKWYERPHRFVLIPVAVSRGAVFLPAAMYTGEASRHWRLIQNNFQLHSGLYGSSIISAEKIAAKWGSFGLFWSFSVLVPALIFPSLSLPVAAVDFVISAYIATATHYQASFVPHRTRACANAAYTWHKPAGANETFFQAAARLNETVATPVKMCETFVTEWTYGLVQSILYSLLGFGNIVAFITILLLARHRGEPLWKSTLDLAKASVIVVFVSLKGIAVLLIAFVWLIPRSIFRCLPRSFTTKVRFGRACVLKGGLGAEQKVELKVMELKYSYKQSKEPITRYKYDPGTPSPLSNFFDTYDMLIAVTEHLHYSDVINLGRTSKSLRNAIFPSNFIDQREATYERYTCHDASRAKCWLCDRQICSYCHQLPLVEHGRYYRHLESCRPYCSSCYHSTILTPQGVRNKTYKPQPACNCGPALDHQPSNRKFSRPVCRDCNMYSSEELFKMRETKTKRLLMEGMNSDGGKRTKCSRPRCFKDLGTGPRWWVCKQSGCGRECKSMVHKGWGQKADGQSDAVGEDAV